ncbi:phosphatase PAP2 family protein, partial [Acidobacteriota bacterium]
LLKYAMIKKKFPITTAKFLLFFTILLVVNTYHSPALPSSGKLNFQYQHTLTGLHLQDINVEKERLKLNGEYWEGFVSDIKDTFSAPFQWKGDDWLRVAVVTGITTGLYFNDEPIMSWVQQHRGKTTARIAWIAEKFGNPKKVLTGLVLLYGIGSLFKDQKAQHIALLSFKTSIATILVVKGFKLLFHRSRPGSSGPGKWGGPSFSFNNETQSFPSGHSALAFSLAVVIASEYKGTVIPVIAYGTAVLTALSRVHDKKHWASDIFFGSIIGYFIARQIVKKSRDVEQNLALETFFNGPPNPRGFYMRPFSLKGSNTRIRAFPLVDLNSLGLSLSMEF